MIKFYLNRELSERLGIRLSKWKRWSREFLPPDPLGGLQSGYARQYTIDQAFTVYLGGHLVAALYFSIPQARQIVHELGPWIKTHKQAFSGKAPESAIKDTQVYIFKQVSPSSREVAFAYLERSRLSDTPYEKGGPHVRQEVYQEKPIPVVSSSNGLDTLDTDDKMGSRILYVSHLYDCFMAGLNS